MISESEIMKKAQAYADSPRGKKRIDAFLKERRKNGAPLADGTVIVGEDGMREAAGALIAIIRKHLPESIAKVGDSLSSTNPAKLATGEYNCFVRFSPGALRRESLDNGTGYTGEGIDNIVALFNNGYRASGHVYGWWDGHSPTGDALYRSSGSDSFAWVRSRKEREALHFMQDAVKEFNTTYSTKYGVTAELGSDYLK